MRKQIPADLEVTVANNTDGMFEYQSPNKVLTLNMEKYGDEEFVLKTKQAFSQKGAIDLDLLDTNVTMTLTTADGFEREVEVFRAFTVEEAENIQQSAEQMESAKQIREQVRKLIKKEYEKLPVSKE